jgi:hypothetical protein
MRSDPSAPIARKLGSQQICPQLTVLRCEIHLTLCCAMQFRANAAFHVTRVDISAASTSQNKRKAPELREAPALKALHNGLRESRYSLAALTGRGGLRRNAGTLPANALASAFDGSARR